MSYNLERHPHQSDLLKFLPADYVPYQINQGEKTYGVIAFFEGMWEVHYQRETPVLGGYIAKESIYGSPKYCPNATRHHRKHLAMYGTMPHLVFFDSEKTAEQAGFRKCERCFS